MASITECHENESNLNLLSRGSKMPRK
jgi:ATP-dependent Lon protease